MHSLLHQQRVTVNRDEYDAGGGVPAEDLPRRVDAVEDRHGDISHDRVGQKANCRLNKGSAIAHRCHDVEFRLQQLSEKRSSGRLIVREDDARSACFWPAPHDGVMLEGTAGATVAGYS